MLIVRLTQSGDAGGTELLDAMDPISIVATLMAVLVGALAGSYDTAQGTMRYLVMTGVPRRRLYAHARARHGDRDRALLRAGDRPRDRRRLRPAATARPTIRRFSAVVGAVWAYLVNPLVFGLVSMAVGSLLHSNGAAIGVSLGFSLGGGILTGARRAYVSETLAGYLLPAATDIVAQLDQQRRDPAGRRLRSDRRVARRVPRRRSLARRCATSTSRGPRAGGRAPARDPRRSRRWRARSPASRRCAGATAPSVGGSIVMFGQDLVEPARHVPGLLAEHARAAPARASGA